MTTLTPRINITCDAEMANFLKTLAEREHKSVSKLAAELIHEALELREDYQLSGIAEASLNRMKENQDCLMVMFGNNMYEVTYSLSAAQDVQKLPMQAKHSIKKAIEERLMTNPLTFGKPLRYSLSGYRSLRVGDYRILYRIQGQEVLIDKIQHRKEVYE